MVKTLLIDMADFGQGVSADDEVRLFNPRVRGSASRAGGLVSTAGRTIRLRDGKASVENVEPGLLTVQLKPQGTVRVGSEFTVVIPDGEGPVTLRSCLENQFRYEPPVVSAVQKAADRSADSERAAISAQRKAEQAAQKATGEVQGVVDTAADRIRDSVKTDADRAVDAARRASADAKATKVDSDSARAAASTAADDAVKNVEGKFATDLTLSKQYADEAKTAASTAVDGVRKEIGDSVDAAKNHEQASEQARVAAEHARGVASQSANAAKTSEDNSSKSAGEIKTVGAHVDEVATHVDSQKTLVDTAVKSVSDNAETSATNAAQAQESARQAKESEKKAQEAAEQAKSGAPAGGWKRTDLENGVRDSLNRADTALQSIPRATATAPGGIQLTGDLEGTADNPKVKGLSQAGQSAEWSNVSGKPAVFPPVEHSHKISDVTGLAEELKPLQEVASKAYVDKAVKDAPKMHVWDGKGTWKPPASAGVNDTVLNTAKGEIYAVQDVK